MIEFDPTRRSVLASANCVLLNRSSASRVADVENPMTPTTVSVLDHIPSALHAAIRMDRCRTDLSAFFQNAAIAANGGKIYGQGRGGTVSVPAGTYPISNIGIRDTIIMGENAQRSRLVAIPGTASGTFMLDAMRDRDGTTLNTSGSGYASNLVIDAANTGASGLRTYGGGCIVRNLTVLHAQTGLAAGLPIWSTFSNIHTADCEIGIHTFAMQPGDSGTSTTFLNCWADRSRRYGFHITQLMYSSLVNCAAQDSGDINFYIEGDVNKSPAAYSLQLIGCGTEGCGKPFYLRKCRDLTLIGARIVAPADGVDHITLDDSAGSIRDFSTVGPPRAPAVSVRLINHGAPPGGVLIDGSIVSIDPKFQASYAVIGGSINDRACIQAPAMSLSASAGTASTQIEMVGSVPAMTWRSPETRLAAFSLRGGTILSATPDVDLLQALDKEEVAISLTSDRRGLRFLFKDDGGHTRAIEIPGHIVS